MAGNYQVYQTMPQRPRRRPGCSAFGLSLLAGVMWLVALGFGYVSYDFTQRGVAVESRVIGYMTVSDSDGTSYSPVYRYEFEGRQYDYESVNASNPPSHQTGEVVTLLVDPNNPNRARVDSFFELWLLPVALAGAALLMLVIGAFIAFWGRA